MIDTPTSCPVLSNNTESYDLEPLLEFLRQDGISSEEIHFPAGTLRQDGRLDLCKQNLGVEGCGRVVEALESQRFVNTLLLGTNAIGDEGAAQVAHLIRQGNLESVYLGCNLIGFDGVNQIAEALETDQHVKALWLKRNPLTPKGIRRLAKMLKSNHTLRTLDVVNSSPDHDSMLELLEIISTHPSLQYLYLSGNGLDAEEAPAIANCLQNSSLKGLYLSVNHLGNDGAKILAETLEHNTSLEFLSLASNSIGDAGVRDICDALHQHPSLVSLDFGYSASTKVLGAQANQLTEVSVSPVRDLIQNSPALRDLNLHPNQFSEASRLLLLDTAKQRGTLERLMLQSAPSIRGMAPTHPDASSIRSVYR
jgi:Ran GTPase-activating protein (RanGAP) involved in mRNA processing and transport